MKKEEVVITGFAVLSPIGNDKETFWTSQLEGKSGIGFLNIETSDDALRPMGGTVPDFQAKNYVQPRKNIKVMSRDIQLAYVAACLSCTDAGLITQGDSRSVDSDRFGVVFGSDLIGTEVDLELPAYRKGIADGQYDFSRWGIDAMSEIFPLWMLKFLPNMPACHICIAHDARGPSNSLTLSRCSSLAAIIEAARNIERGAADVMLAGGCGNRINQDFLVRTKAYYTAERRDTPTTVPRPFDADRCGNVLAEGAGSFVLERRSFAEARGAKICAVIRGYSETNEPHLHKSKPTGEGIRRSFKLALQRAGMKSEDIGFVNADGVGTKHADRVEAEAIRAVIGDVPVVSNKGNIGDAGSGAGAVELASALLSLEHKIVPPTLNHTETASDCPINVVHDKPLPFSKRTVLKTSHTEMGRSCTLILEN
ncbi:MAG: beta-ketoacyl-[acyl-carrier-protein] synthase family protein [Planctomycetaceae bacterium]|nr:beta-ketoacyl-[acyl-carrier-protein] synthase family protein [Planctomycetaceae bacterium]